MNHYNNELFLNILGKLSENNVCAIRLYAKQSDALNLQYFLTRKYYYATIVDDYPEEIKDKKSLLEALYYQVKLITMHDLNWDAFDESLNDSLNNFLEFNGICLIFRDAVALEKRMMEELNVFYDVINGINLNSANKKISVIFISE